MPARATREGPSPKLSLVVVAYDMNRQLGRTLRSLAPDMQRGIAADEYEVIVVDNGSPDPIDLSDYDLKDTRVRLLTVEDAAPSPVRAINSGIADAIAPLVGAMIDGARAASPGLLRGALSAYRTHPRPVIATLGFHLGTEPQYEAIANGYDEAEEERLLASVDWQSDGYRLFDISVPAASAQRGWSTAPPESNALFMPAELWTELGGYDESFTSPGGGLANHDVFERACRLPGSELILLFGEGTFHQLHGGVAANSPVSRWNEYTDEYLRVRGRRYERPSLRPLLLGSPTRSAIACLPLDPADQGVEEEPRSERVPGERARVSGLERRYLDLLKKVLLNETALEAEAAYFMTRDALDSDRQVDDRVLLDVRRGDPDYFAGLAEARAVGRYFERKPRNIGFGYTMVGRARLENVENCVVSVLDDDVPGDLVECGVWRGGASILMRAILAIRNITDRSVWLADSFAGLPKPKLPQDKYDLSAEKRPELAVELDRVKHNFEIFALLDEQVRFLPGWFEDTLPNAPVESIAILRLDGDMYESTRTALDSLYDKVTPGGFVIIDDYGVVTGCRLAVDEFREERGIDAQLEEIDFTGTFWRKSLRAES